MADRLDAKRRLGRAGILAIAAGAGAGAGLSAAGAVPGAGALTVFLSLFLASSNFVDNEADGLPLVGAACLGVGLQLGASAGEASRVLFAEGVMMLATGRVQLFIALVMLFHVVEFAFVVRCHPKDIAMRSLMLSPVPYGGYSVAMVMSLIEFWAEAAAFSGPSPRLVAAGTALTLVGCVACFAGWALRAAALFTARSNFTHLVSYQKKSAHVLVTAGVYRICRHPGYLGWFVWSVATQLILCNPVCFGAFVYVSWVFFAGRIPGEERMLVEFFGEEYLSYARRVPCGIPCISELRT